MFGTSRGLSRWCSTLALDMKPHRYLIIKTQTVPLYFDVLSPSLKWFFSIALIRDFDISVSLDLRVKVIGSGQRTIARFEKSPTWSSGTSRLFWLANVFLPIQYDQCAKALGVGWLFSNICMGCMGICRLTWNAFSLSDFGTGYTKPLVISGRGVYFTSFWIWNRVDLLSIKIKSTIGIPVHRLRGVGRWPQKQWTLTNFCVTHTK